MQPGDSASVLQGVAVPGSEIVLMNRTEKASLRPNMRKVTKKASTLFQRPKPPYYAAPIGII
jgi:hypothetical protein